MSLITKIVIDTSEYNRLLNIEHEYKKLKEKYSEQIGTKHAGSGKEICICANKTDCQCAGMDGHGKNKTPPLSKIIALNEQARSIEIPPRGILPSITDPNDKNLDKNLDDKAEKKTKLENLNTNEWRLFADDKTNWYFLGHYEEK